MIKINDQIGSWTVLHNDVKVLRSSGHNVINCEIQCTCGYKRLVRTSTLRNLKEKGKTTHSLKNSCKNCNNKALKMQSNELRIIESLYNYYKIKTEKRKKNIEFNLSIEDYTNLIKCDCIYCGAKPTNKYRMKYVDGDAFYIYQGIDRIDPDKHYDIHNVVPCCINCNAAKRLQNVNEFTEWIQILIKNNLSSTVRERMEKFHSSIVGSSEPKRETPTKMLDGDMT